MPRSQKACRECGRLAVDGWHISRSGICRLCAVAKAVDLTNALFPADPVPAPADVGAPAEVEAPAWSGPYHYAEPSGFRW